MLPIPDDCFKLVISKLKVDNIHTLGLAELRSSGQGIYFFSKRLLPLIVSVHPVGSNASFWTRGLKLGIGSHGIITKDLIEYYAYHGFPVNPFGFEPLKLYSDQEKDYNAMLHRISQSPFNQPTPMHLIQELFTQGMAATLDQLFTEGKASTQKITNQGITAAIKRGHLDCIKVYMRHGCTPEFNSLSLTSEAIRNDQAEILEYLLSNAALGDHTCDRTCVIKMLCRTSIFHRECLAVARKVGLGFTKDDLRDAVHSGNVGMVEYMIDENNVRPSDIHLPLNDELTSYAAQQGHVQMLQLLFDNGCEPLQNILHWALHSPNKPTKSELLRLTLQGDCLLTKDMLRYAAGNLTVGQFKVLVGSNKWKAHFRSYPEICAEAACREDTTMLEYLHSIDMVWDESTCASAAEYDRLKCLKFAHENGCPWDRTVCKRAVTFDSFSCLKYAIKEGCSTITLDLIQHAVELKRKSMFKYLCRHSMQDDALHDWNSDSEDDSEDDCEDDSASESDTYWIGQHRF